MSRYTRNIQEAAIADGYPQKNKHEDVMKILAFIACFITGSGKLAMASSHITGSADTDDYLFSFLDKRSLASIRCVNRKAHQLAQRPWEQMWKQDAFSIPARDLQPSARLSTARRTVLQERLLSGCLSSCPYGIIRLSRLGLMNKDLPLLAAAINSRFRRLGTLDLSVNKIGIEGARYLARHLMRDKICSLDLRGNTIRILRGYHVDFVNRTIEEKKNVRADKRDQEIEKLCQEFRHLGIRVQM